MSWIQVRSNLNRLVWGFCFLMNRWNFLEYSTVVFLVSERKLLKVFSLLAL